MRVAYRVAYRVLGVWAVLVPARGRGVKCLLTDDAGRVLFVRHHYGNRRQWELPGGGTRRDESAPEAARREAWEELGADVEVWEDAATTAGIWHHRDQALTVCSAPWPGGSVRPDPIEIAAADWFALDAPPIPLGPTTVAALAVLRHK
jgi:NAD+ diphosphatase